MELVKESIRDLKEYVPNNLKYRIKLDANEGKNILFKDIYKEGIKFEGDFNINFYPDNEAILLREEIGKYININPANIIAGNGSSEMIELIIKTFVDKDEVILSFAPTFSMYSIFSKIYSTKFIGIKSNEDFSVDIELLINKAKEVNPKVVILCNPNNPTGYLIDEEHIKRLLEKTDSIVVVDEAYIEFAGDSMVNEIGNYKNLIVLRTLSKALGLASVRLGYMASNEKIINIINKVRSPYNLNALTQYVGVMALKNKDKIMSYVEKVKKEREFLYSKLKEIDIKAFKSYGNFIFFKCEIADLKYKLANHGILIRDFSEDLKGYFRVTVGSKYENREFIKCLKEIKENEKS
ncbi:histidinol-phosphate transaminase [Clostridium sp. UBA6640]|uniref:histidinol-phosphate transaminase n=1 Tax=Clostridium sp. UBA6640 TaxID=1946370 RepID=UPI0025C15D3A|nr:histidinol-phosphate transaminase [Clostridium sp. UBA6640]